MKYLRLFTMGLATCALSCTALFAQQDNQQGNQRPDPPSTPSAPTESGHRYDSSGDQAQHFIDDFDENDDGQLQRKELPPRMRDRFSSLDRDGDNRLSRQELFRHGQAARSQRNPVAPLEFVYIWVTDADQGHLSLNELQRAYDTLQKIDQDGNGELARSELQACREANLSKWARMVTTRLDENDDDTISEQEAQGTFLTGRFDELDTNGDSRIDKQELKQCACPDAQSESAKRNDDQSQRTGRRQESDSDHDDRD
jgi:Ca2+-binding EF-hand superfamily protein